MRKIYKVRRGQFYFLSTSFVFQLGEVEVLTEDVVLAGTLLTVTLVARDGTKAVRKLSKC